MVDAKGKFAKANRCGGRLKGSKIRLTVKVKELIIGELANLEPKGAARSCSTGPRYR